MDEDTEETTEHEKERTDPARSQHERQESALMATTIASLKVQVQKLKRENQKLSDQVDRLAARLAAKEAK